MSRGRELVGDVIPFTSPPYGLLSPATTQLDLPGRKWRLGIVWEPLCPQADGTINPCATLPVDDEPREASDKAATTEWDVRGATPFTAYASIECSAPGMWEVLPASVRAALTRSEETFIEHAFWTGNAAFDSDPGTDGAVLPHLASDTEVIDGQDLMQPAATVVTDVPQPIAVAIGMLESAMAECYHGVATLHVPLRLGALMARDNLLDTRGGTARTPTGSKIVLGAGYPGTAPDGTSEDGVSWIFATGEVFYQRAEAQDIGTRVESLDRSDNTVRLITERDYVIGWDCCLLAIPVIDEAEETS